MGWVLYCKHIYIVIESVCTCHYNKNIQYNTIHKFLHRYLNMFLPVAHISEGVAFPKVDHSL